MTHYVSYSWQCIPGMQNAAWKSSISLLGEENQCLYVRPTCVRKISALPIYGMENCHLAKSEHYALDILFCKNVLVEYNNITSQTSFFL